MDEKSQLRFSKTSCYLCSEWLGDDEIDEHLIECSNKSIVCPEGCGAVVARKNMQSHWIRCTKVFGETESQSNQENDNYTDDSFANSQTNTKNLDQMNLIAEELQCMRLTLSDEVQFRIGLMAQLQQLKQRSNLIDKWTAKVNTALLSFNKIVSLEANRRNVDVSSLEQRHNQLESWRLDMTTRFNSIESKIYNSDDSGPQYYLTKMSALQQQMDRVEHELQCLQKTEILMNGTLENQRQSNKEEDVVISQSDEKQTVDLENMKKTINDVADKHTNIAYRLQDALQQVFECKEQVLQMVKKLEKYRRETYYTKQRLDALQANLKLEEKLAVLSANNGRVIWRIDGFEKRFLESQDNDTLLKGPIFTNQPFGYVLQLEVSLYGIGTWRGRNLIAGLTVLKGAYDSLLPWPCMLTGTISLRDQPDLRSSAMDICKPIIAKRKEQQNDKHQYVYIPHDVLRSRHYIRDDTIFLEVIFDQENLNMAAQQII